MLAAECCIGNSYAIDLKNYYLYVVSVATF
jgi:hypothetical protein